MHLRVRCARGLLKKGTWSTRRTVPAVSLTNTITSRFPVVSAFHIQWDSRKPPGQRILDIRLESESADSKSEFVLEKVEREPGRLYRIVTREYMAQVGLLAVYSWKLLTHGVWSQGHDGFQALKGSTYLIDEEHGMPMSTLVRRYLLGKS
jgi:5'-nucleotidase